ncbi:MAG: cation:proton antiporter [Candidatus Woesearchaeota archaeon]
MDQLMMIAVILLFGTLVTALASVMQVSNVFFLVLGGMLFGLLSLGTVSQEVLVVISELALILVVFHATAKLHLHSLLFLAKQSIKLSLVFLGLCVLIIGFFFLVFFFVPFSSLLAQPSLLLSSEVVLPLLFSLLFAVLMFGIDPVIALQSAKEKNQKLFSLMKVEAILNTPLTVVLSFVLLTMITTQTHTLTIQNLVFLLKQFMIPLAVGLAIGYLLVYLLMHIQDQALTHLMMLTAAVLSYVLAQALLGNGVLAVTMFGLVFGNHRIRHKLQLETFAGLISNTLTILVFFMLGMAIITLAQYRTMHEVMLGTLLFVIYLLVRYSAVVLALGRTLTRKERLLMTLTTPKGIDVAVVLFLAIATLAVYPQMEIVANISILFILYSIVLSTIASIFLSWFFDTKNHAAAGLATAASTAHSTLASTKSK